MLHFCSIGRKNQMKPKKEENKKKMLTHLSSDGHLHEILISIFKNGIYAIRDCIINNIEEPQQELVTSHSHKRHTNYKIIIIICVYAAHRNHRPIELSTQCTHTHTMFLFINFVVVPNKKTHVIWIHRDPWSNKFMEYHFHCIDQAVAVTIIIIIIILHHSVFRFEFDFKSYYDSNEFSPNNQQVIAFLSNLYRWLWVGQITKRHGFR